MYEVLKNRSLCAGFGTPCVVTQIVSEHVAARYLSKDAAAAVGSLVMSCLFGVYTMLAFELEVKSMGAAGARPVHQCYCFSLYSRITKPSTCSAT